MSEEILYGFPERPINFGKAFRIDHVWLQEQKRIGRSDAAIAQELGTSASAIANARHRHGITRASGQALPNRGGRAKLPVDIDWLEEQKRLGRSDLELTKELGVSASTIIRRRRAYNIGCCRPARPNPLLPDADWLREQKEMGRADSDIAKELGVRTDNIASYRQALHIPGLTTSLLHRLEQMNLDIQWLKEQKDNGRSDAAIAEELRCSYHTIMRVRRKLGVASLHDKRVSKPDVLIHQLGD